MGRGREARQNKVASLPVKVVSDEKKKAVEAVGLLHQIAGLAPVNKAHHIACDQAREHLLKYIDSKEGDEKTADLATARPTGPSAS